MDRLYGFIFIYIYMDGYIPRWLAHTDSYLDLMYSKFIDQD